MKRRFIILPLFACALIVFSGQQRNVPQRPIRAPQPRPAAPAPAPPPVPVVEPPHPMLFPLVVLRPDDLVWPQPGQGDRSAAPQSIALLGDTRNDGLYVIRTKIPAGKQIVPHVHADSRSVVVISGTYYFGIGKTFDVSELRAFPPGSFLTEPAGMPHYSWAKDGDVILHVTAIGPSSTRVLPDEPSAASKDSE